MANKVNKIPWTPTLPPPYGYAAPPYAPPARGGSDMLIILVGLGAVAVGGYFLWKMFYPDEEECTEGDTKCVGVDLWTCVCEDDKCDWELTEKNSPECMEEDEFRPLEGYNEIYASYW